MASTANVVHMPQQLSLMAGGATVDTSTIGSIKFTLPPAEAPAEA